MGTYTAVQTTALRSGNAPRPRAERLEPHHCPPRKHKFKKCRSLRIIHHVYRRRECRPNAVIPAHALAPSKPESTYQLVSSHVQVSPKTITYSMQSQEWLLCKSMNAQHVSNSPLVQDIPAKNALQHIPTKAISGLLDLVL